MLNRELRGKGWVRYKRQFELQLFAYLGIVFLAVFSWAPLFGLIIAFKDYSINTGISGIFTSQWNNFKFFKEFFTSYRFSELLRNTMVVSVLKLIFTFPAPIILALLLSEVRVSFFKRFVQTVSYLPNFISWVLVYTITYNLLSEEVGAINNLMVNLGIIEKSLPIMSSPDHFYSLAVGLSVWKTTGWSAIIFLAAISGVAPALYEAASIDGAGRLGRIWHVTLPSIRGAIITVLIISIGGMLGGGMGGSNFEISYLFGNPNNYKTADIIQKYAFDMGLKNGRFAFATAVDLCQSIISVTLVLISNKIAKMISGEGLF